MLGNIRQEHQRNALFLYLNTPSIFSRKERHLRKLYRIALSEYGTCFWISGLVRNIPPYCGYNKKTSDLPPIKAFCSFCTVQVSGKHRNCVDIINLRPKSTKRHWYRFWRRMICHFFCPNQMHLPDKGSEIWHFLHYCMTLAHGYRNWWILGWKMSV